MKNKNLEKYKNDVYLSKKIISKEFYENKYYN